MSKFDYMDIELVNSADVEEHFSTLYHWTSIKTALKVLRSRNVFSKTDAGKHANFHVQPSPKDFEKAREVCLKFKFVGNHQLMFGDTFDTPDSPPNSSDSIYHLITSSWGDYISGNTSIGNLEHWQSNVYPNTDGLVFLGIETFDDKFSWFSAIDKNEKINEPKSSFGLMRYKSFKDYEEKVYWKNLKFDIEEAEMFSKNKHFVVMPY